MLGTGDAMYILNPETLVRTHVTPDTSTVTIKFLSIIEIILLM
jgi:hypothetical protein